MATLFGRLGSNIWPRHSQFSRNGCLAATALIVCYFKFYILLQMDRVVSMIYLFRSVFYLFGLKQFVIIIMKSDYNKVINWPPNASMPISHISACNPSRGLFSICWVMIAWKTWLGNTVHLFVDMTGVCTHETCWQINDRQACNMFHKSSGVRFFAMFYHERLTISQIIIEHQDMGPLRYCIKSINPSIESIESIRIFKIYFYFW